MLIISSMRRSNCAIPRGKYDTKGIIAWKIGLLYYYLVFIELYGVALLSQGSYMAQNNEYIDIFIYWWFFHLPFNNKEWWCQLKGKLRPKRENILPFLNPNFLDYVINLREWLYWPRGKIWPKRVNPLERFIYWSFVNFILQSKGVIVSAQGEALAPKK